MRSVYLVLTATATVNLENVLNYNNPDIVWSNSDSQNIYIKVFFLKKLKYSKIWWCHVSVRNYYTILDSVICCTIEIREGVARFVKVHVINLVSS